MPKQRSTQSVRKATCKTRVHSLAEPNGNATNSTIQIEENIHSCEIARQQVIAALPSIIRGLIDKAKEGGCQQTKLLLDLCDVKTLGSTHLEGKNPQQLCDALLDGLQFSENHSNGTKRNQNAS